MAYVHMSALCTYHNSTSSNLKAIKTFIGHAGTFDPQQGLPEINLLRYDVNGRSITSEPAKVKAILAMAVPDDMKAVRCFLGMTGYCRQCIPNYA